MSTSITSSEVELNAYRALIKFIVELGQIRGGIEPSEFLSQLAVDYDLTIEEASEALARAEEKGWLRTDENEIPLRYKLGMEFE